MVQYNLQQGLKLFGEQGEVATTKELKQKHDMDALIPLKAEEFSEEEKNREMVGFIKVG